MKTFAAVALASGALFSLASAQEQYSIAPNSVSSSDRKYWCQQQITQCPLICLQPPSETATTNANSCDSDNLTYDCECADGLRPNVTQYTQTLPFFICQEWGNQCVNNCGAGNNDCASDCRENHPCGAQDPIKPNSTSSSSTMTGSASRTASDAGATTDSSESTGGSGGFVRASTTGDDSSSAQESASSSESAGVGRASGLEFGYTFGVVALAGVFFGGFALAL